MRRDRKRKREREREEIEKESKKERKKRGGGCLFNVKFESKGVESKAVYKMVQEESLAFDRANVTVAPFNWKVYALSVRTRLHFIFLIHPLNVQLLHIFGTDFSTITWLLLFLFYFRLKVSKLRYHQVFLSSFIILHSGP